MISREAQLRFFFYINSFLLMMFYLFVSPTSATAPQAVKHAGPAVPTVSQAKEELKSMPNASTTAVHTQRQSVQTSRDELRTVARNGQVKVSEREIELLARLVYAEGRGEPYEGQVAIAAVVLNRVASPGFPSTVREVIFAPNAFSPVRNGQLPTKTNETARKAVLEALQGNDPTHGSLYFFNPKTATSKWIWTRKQTVSIANHTFAK
ncbi:cell wall hydrolase [Brevibacillus sp. TJ4]|uniref:cell wall hydrolase n=1 Tax=Brevibacillus sp. TJ4 TaxID=3234853 RepID=UPI0037CDDEA3